MLNFSWRTAGKRFFGWVSLNSSFLIYVYEFHCRLFCIIFCSIYSLIFLKRFLTNDPERSYSHMQCVIWEISKMFKNQDETFCCANVQSERINFPLRTNKASQVVLHCFEKPFQLYTPILIVWCLQASKALAGTEPRKGRLQDTVFTTSENIRLTIKVWVLYLSRAPISLVTFSDVWMTIIGFDNTWDRSIYSRKRSN